MGVARIKRNLKLGGYDLIESCKEKIKNCKCKIYRKGKNWYCELDGVRITVNSYSDTIITAYQMRKG